MTEPVLHAGERVLLIDQRGRRYLITLATGRQFHSHMGPLDHDDLIGHPEGSTIRVGGKPVLAFRPTLADYTLKMRRGAQVVYPKDIGLIIVFADIGPGHLVVEAGTGSGSLTLALARAVGPEGRVVSYEIRQDHHDQAVENITNFYEGLGGKPENLELRVGDVTAGIPERGIDRLVLDLPEPWTALGTLADCLNPGAVLCCYLPTVPQVQQTVEAMRSGGFALVETLEGLVRTWHVEGLSVRPDHRMVAHTGFLVVGRKTAT